MICDPCAQGDHCGTDWCTCQHNPPGTGQPKPPVQNEGPPVPTSFTPKAFVPPAMEDAAQASDTRLADLLARWLENS